MDTLFSPDLLGASKDKTYYALTMFPYPSGIGLHAGHASNYTINDVVARYKRMQGYTVLNPIGFDAFGLPTENYAIQQGKPARQVTDENKLHFLNQLKALNMSFDYSRVLDTSEPEYYKWTQRIFSKLYEAGLVYRDTLWVNRCPSCMTVLANDQVVDGKCERCKTEIIQKKHPQWFIKITDYADRLIADLDDLDRPIETKTAQKNRIGRSEGAEIDFKVAGSSESPIITCFTTRPDTIYGVTALVLSPENNLLDDLLDTDRKSEVEAYRQTTLAKTAVQRQKDLKEKTGIDSGLKAIHPLTGEQIPIRYADYVLAGYGSGAVMSVPAHDQRDKEFAEKFGIEVKQVIKPEIGEKRKEMVSRKTGYGIIRDPKNDKYLIIQLGTNHVGKHEKPLYGFPGGGIDQGESIKEGVKREIVEETGYSNINQVSDFIQIDAYYDFQMKNVYRENIGHYALFDLESDDNIGPKLTNFEKIQGIKLHRYTKNEINNLDLYPILREVIDIIIGGKTIREGILINSGEFDGLTHIEGQEKIIAHLESLGVGRKKTTYKLRDRSVSRQRYWGSPIPVYYDKDGADHLVPESELPVELPLDLENYQPTGKSPLEDHPTFPQYEKKKITALLIHGRGNSSQDPGCLGGVQRSLEEQGVEVIFPDLTYHKDFDFNKTLDDLMQYDADIIVGHSSGGFLALHRAEKKKPKEIILIAPTSQSFCNEIKKGKLQDERYLIFDDRIMKLITEWFGEEEGKKYVSFHDHDVICDWLKNQRTKIFWGEEDEILQDSLYERYEGNDIAILPGRGHMGTREGTDSIEEINEYLTSQVSLLKSQTYTRECDTLDTFMCSSFYFLRFPDVDNPDELIRKELADKMFPIDFYIGGKEHTVGHLLYSRFIHKFLFDQGYVSSEEPFAKLVHQGMVLGADGRKMGKRHGNGVDPLEVIEQYGTDAVRTYLMFMGPVESDKPWSETALNGVAKFLKRVGALLDMEWRNTKNDAVTSMVHETIQGITHDIDRLKLNTCVSKLMILVNTIYEHKAVTDEQLLILAQLLAPFATDIATHIWTTLGGEGDVHISARPVADPSLIQTSTINLPIQINGKMRGNMDISAGLTEDEVVALAKEVENIAKRLEEGEIKKIIWVQDKILNLIVK